MTEERKKEIALMYCRMRIKRDMERILSDKKELEKAVNNTAEEVGIEPQEAMEFLEELLKDEFGENYKTLFLPKIKGSA